MECCGATTTSLSSYYQRSFGGRFFECFFLLHPLKLILLCVDQFDYWTSGCGTHFTPFPPQRRELAELLSCAVVVVSNSPNTQTRDCWEILGATPMAQKMSHFC
jgi:hypothetical protein